MRPLKASQFANDREYRAAQKQMRASDRTKRQGRDARRMNEAPVGVAMGCEE